MKYNKLVRDRIPEIIRAKGKEPITHIADGAEYAEKLREKLLEEVNEYRESHAPEELADILEVLYALAELDQLTQAALEEIRRTKADERGSFRKRIILEEA